MTYGVKEIGMDYERSLFGMKMNDVTSLAKALKVGFSFEQAAALAVVALGGGGRAVERTHRTATPPRLAVRRAALTPHSETPRNRALPPSAAAERTPRPRAQVTETLTVLSLPCNLLDDNTTRILATGLQGNATITALDLSHNKIADRGVKAVRVPHAGTARPSRAARRPPPL